MDIFAERLKELRGKKSQEEIAEAIGITPQSLGRYEKGTRTPDIEILKKMAEHFKVSTDYLLGLSPNKTTDPDINNACELTGLSEETIKEIIKHKEYDSFTRDPVIPILDKLLGNSSFFYILTAIKNYKKFTSDYVNTLMNAALYSDLGALHDKADLERFRAFDDLKAFIENTFKHPAYDKAREYFRKYLIWHKSESSDFLYMPLMPPAPLRVMTPPYPSHLSKEEIEELEKNAPTQEEIEKYNRQKALYEKNLKQSEIDLEIIKELFEKEVSDNAKHNPETE